MKEVILSAADLAVALFVNILVSGEAITNQSRHILGYLRRFEKIIIDGYGWLVDNYKPGDRIYLFGK